MLLVVPLVIAIVVELLVFASAIALLLNTHVVVVLLVEVELITLIFLRWKEFRDELWL